MQELVRRIEYLWSVVVRRLEISDSSGSLIEDARPVPLNGLDD